MFSFGRNIKAWLFITLCSLLIWIAYWFQPAVNRIYNFVFVRLGTLISSGRWMYFWMEVSSGIGTILRSIVVLAGFMILFLIVKDSNKGLYEIRKWIVLALIGESLYYAMVGFPAGVYIVGGGYSGQIVALGISYLLQFLFVTPFFIFLAVKVYQYKMEPSGFEAWRWVGVAFMAYILALWANSTSRLFDMVIVYGIGFFSNTITAVGALNTFLFMSLAVIFAVLGAYNLAKPKKGTAPRWVGLALAMVGLHYLIYLVHSYYAGMPGYIWLVDIWTIPLLGLGLSMLKQKPIRLRQIFKI